jgi:hypothetical protein
LLFSITFRELHPESHVDYWHKACSSRKETICLI